MKPGAVENLNRRVDKIEQLLQKLQQQADSARSYQYAPSHIQRNGSLKQRDASDLLQMFEKEMKDFKMMSDRRAEASFRSSAQPDDEQFEDPKRHGEFILTPKAKRRRLILREEFNWGELLLYSSLTDAVDKHSAEELLGSVIDNYFSQVHPWLPMLHETSFRQQFEEQVYGTHLEVILHAMIVAAVRLAIRPDTATTLNRTSQLTKRSRDWVMLHALDSLSVENLQALLIIAFDDVRFVGLNLYK